MTARTTTVVRTRKGDTHRFPDAWWSTDDSGQLFVKRRHDDGGLNTVFASGQWESASQVEPEPEPLETAQPPAADPEPRTPPPTLLRDVPNGTRFKEGGFSHTLIKTDEMVPDEVGHRFCLSEAGLGVLYSIREDAEIEVVE